MTKKTGATHPHPLKFLCLKKFPGAFCHAATFEKLGVACDSQRRQPREARLAIPIPSPRVPEVATLVDDVRYCGKSGPSADAECTAVIDPKRTFDDGRFGCTVPGNGEPSSVGCEL
jgi:hypothetical protein